MAPNGAFKAWWAMSQCSLTRLSMAFSFRSGPARVFANYRDYDDGAAATMQLGVTTYRPTDDGDESYQTTYIEWGGRSDHLIDAIHSSQGKDVTTRLVSTATDSDRTYVATSERNGITPPVVNVIPITA